MFSVSFNILEKDNTIIFIKGINRTLLSHSFNSIKEVLSTNYVPDTLQDTRYGAVNKADLPNSNFNF